MENANILIIEDNAEVRENLAEILALYGYRIQQAPDGLAGARLAIEQPPDMVLCDVMMPGLDGFGVLNLLSQNERTAAVPFVFITARTETEDIRRGMNLGADDYITKPFYKDELLEVIRTRLRKAALRGSTGPAPATSSPRLSDPERGHRLLEEAFATEGRQLRAERGQIIVREGDHPHFLYRLVAGRVHLVRTHEYGREYIIAELGPTDYFGLPSLLERDPYYYSARAASQENSYRQLPRQSVLALINREPTVGEAVMRLLAGRVVRHAEHLVQQAYDSVRRRTALTLCDLHDTYGSDRPIDLSREELAQMVGSTKESVTRALSDFRKDGLLTTEGRLVRLTAPEALRALLV